MHKQREWTVLLVAGASGSGKSSLAYRLAKHYSVNVLELDDIHIAVEAASSKDSFPTIHYPLTSSINWEKEGIEATINWLKAVSLELQPVIQKIVGRHIEDKLPVIIEGDFLTPESIESMLSDDVKAVFICEVDSQQINQNFISREGGAEQTFRAEVSANYGHYLLQQAQRKEIPVVYARPWATLHSRVIDAIDSN